MWAVLVPGFVGTDGGNNMADYTVAKGNIAVSEKAAIDRNTVGGAALGAGEVVRLNSSGRWIKAQADDADNAGTQGNIGITLTSCEGDGKSVIVVREDAEFNPGFALVAGTQVVLSAAVAGSLAPDSDLVSTNIPVVLGTPVEADKLYLFPVVGEVAVT